MGLSTGLSGVAVLALGLWIGVGHLREADINVFASLLVAGGVLWIMAAMVFTLIAEQPGATQGGGNALTVAVGQLTLLTTDKPFRLFVCARGLLLSVALAPPFYVLIAQQQSDSTLLGLGALIIANGLGSSLSAPFWGYLGDRSSKQVILIATIGASLLGIFTFMAITNHWQWAVSEIAMALIFLVLNIMHSGVRLGRKVYLVDMASGENRAAYVAVSNTVIGVLMLLGGLMGLIGDWLGASATILILSLLSLVAVLFVRHLPDVSDP